MSHYEVLRGIVADLDDAVCYWVAKRNSAQKEVQPYCAMKKEEKPLHIRFALFNLDVLNDLVAEYTKKRNDAEAEACRAARRAGIG